MHLRVVLALSLGTLLTLGAGCTSIGTLSQEEAEARAETAMQSFSAAMASRDGDDLKRLKGEMTGSSEDDEFGMGTFESTFTMDWGTGDVVHILMDGGSGGFSVTVEAWCTPTQMFLKWGQEVYESRPSAEPETEEWCPTGDAEEEFTEDAFFDGGDFEGLDPIEVEVQDDGTVRATYTDATENMTAVATIDTKGRITRMEMDSDEVTGWFDITYGAREKIPLPQPTARIPAMAWSDTSTTDEGTMAGTVMSAPERPPLDEMELHVVRYDFDTQETQRVAGIALTNPSGSDAGYDFTFTDADGDGRLSEGDRFTIEGPDIGEDFNLDAEFYDSWAEAYANENPIPGPGVALLVLALGGLLGVVRARKR